MLRTCAYENLVSPTKDERTSWHWHKSGSVVGKRSRMVKSSDSKQSAICDSWRFQECAPVCVCVCVHVVVWVCVCVCLCVCVCGHLAQQDPNACQRYQWVQTKMYKLVVTHVDPGERVMCSREAPRWGRHVLAEKAPLTVQFGRASSSFRILETSPELGTCGFLKFKIKRKALFACSIKWIRLGVGVLQSAWPGSIRLFFL